ncbi:MAG TPA: alpha-glucan family phosphorylase [Candidatus Acidoferrales bacterium]|nr:alpha-glucan family phosphorylase [Candidatus Acidoferrales bacterium]
MDVAVEPSIPTYSGGLGVLSGDTLRSAADLGIPMVGLSLIHRKGYFDQQLDEWGNQSESPAFWTPESFLEALPARVSVAIEGREVRVRAWQYSIRGINGHTVPMLFLDTDLPENDPRDRELTDYLFGGDQRYRLCQEVILGFGGVALLHALGFSNIGVYHINEGHAAFVPLALLELRAEGELLQAVTDGNLEEVRSRCVFTTHTPVPAGHDQFPADMVRQVLGDERAAALARIGCLDGGTLNMTLLALRLSRYANGVSMRHGQICREMFPGYRVSAITNGVHAGTWVSEPFGRLYDRYMPEWRRDNLYLRHAIQIPLGEIRAAHLEAKRELLKQVRLRTAVEFDENRMTLGFARRATAYKRADLLFSDMERLRSLAARVGGLQVIYAGKAHPRDEAGKLMIRRVFEAAAALRDHVRVVYLANYDMSLGQAICAGADLWLNTPVRPQEASGTSGMKAALNGVPSLSVLDGWWVEGHLEHVTGWAIEGDGSNEASERDSLYGKLEHVILPLFYQMPEEFARVMRYAIALNGAFFNTQRMVAQYVRSAYRLMD